MERARAPDPLAKRGGSKGKGRGITRPAQASAASAEGWGVPCRREGLRPLAQAALAANKKNGPHPKVRPGKRAPALHKTTLGEAD